MANSLKPQRKLDLIHWVWWLAFTASALLLAASLPGYFERVTDVQLHPEFSGVQLASAWLGAGLSVASSALCLALATLLFFKKPNDPMALFLSFYLFMYSIVLAGPLETFLEYWL